MKLSKILIGGVIFLSLSSAHSENVPSYHPFTMYDSSTPGIGSNETEKVCVVDHSTDPLFDASYWQTVIVNWLNESLGWERVGISKINFVGSCSNPGITIDFVDDDDALLNSTCAGGAACAPYLFGASSTIDGHGHSAGAGIRTWARRWSCNVPPGQWCLDTNQKKRSLLFHEMGHVVGLGHDGPAWGRVGDGGIYDSYPYPHPADSEINQARAHLNGQASSALHPCIGFPAWNKVRVSWFDTANDDTSNKTAVWLDGQHLVDLSQGTSAGIGQRVTFTSGALGFNVNGHWWTARADVKGGPRNTINWDPVLWADTPSPSSETVSAPCTFQLEQYSQSTLQLSWVDASFNEGVWFVYYASADSETAALGSWQFGGACAQVPGAVQSCIDDVGSPPLSSFGAGSKVCARVRGKHHDNENYSPYSNIACTLIPG